MNHIMYVLTFSNGKRSSTFQIISSHLPQRRNKKSDALPELIAILPVDKIISPIINNFLGGKKLCDLFTKDFQARYYLYEIKRLTRLLTLSQRMLF